jgi:ADP-ribosylglycohydrolase
MGTGLDWAGLVAATIAAACDPSSDLDSALGAGLSLVPDAIRREVERALEIADRTKDPIAMREEFDRHYSGTGIVYSMSHGNEICAKAMAVVKATGGSPRECIITAVNFGRDTDCLAAVSGGIAGALSGVGDLPKEWIEQLDAATEANPHTCLKLPIADMAGIVVDGLRREADLLEERASRLHEALV